MGENQDRRIGGKIKEYILRNMGMLGIVFISIAYTATAMITISRNEKTPAQIIVDGVTFLILGVLVTRLLSLQGIMNGERDERVNKTVTLHGQVVKQSEPYIDRLDAWCEVMNAQALKMQRTHILLRNGMKYEDYFDEEGIAREYVPRPFVEPPIPEPPATLTGKERDAWRAREREKVERAREIHDRQETERMRFYTAALRVKLTPLSACALTGEMVRREDPFYFGRTKKEYERTSGRQDLILRVLATIVFGFYSVELIENFNTADLVWKFLQVAFAVSMGLVQMYQSHIYVTEEYRGAIIQKIDHLQMFLRAQETEPSAKEKYKNLINQEEQYDGDNHCPEEHGAEIHLP